MKLVIALCSTLLVLAPTGPAHAGGSADDHSPIQRCDADDGNAIYTDKPCAAFRARPARLSDDLAIRIAMSRHAAAASTPTAAMNVYRDASEPLNPSIPRRRSVDAGCARSPQQLSRDLAGAFALHDVNRVAESYHWMGMSHRQALPIMKQLERLATKPLADARFLAAWIGSGDLPASAVPLDAGLMQLVFAGDGAHTLHFEVRRQSGCYFIASQAMS